MIDSSNVRIGWVDAMKGFTILIVVLGHSVQNICSGYCEETLIYRTIYSFHMPLFMFLSGYVSYKISSWANIRKRSIQLLVPFFSAIVLSYLIHYFPAYSFAGLFKSIGRVVLRPDTGLWFLWALFFIDVLFVGCRKFSLLIHLDERLVVLGVAGVLNLAELLTRFEMFGYHWIAWYFVFFSLGVFWRMYDNHGSHPVLYKVLSVGSLVAFSVLVAFFRMHNETPLFYRWLDLGPYFPVVYRMAIGIAGISFFLCIFKIFNIDNFILTKLGGGTLGIYYLHFFILSLLSSAEFFHTAPTWIAVSALWIATTAISYPLTVLCRRNRLSQLLILGNNTFCKKAIETNL